MNKNGRIHYEFTKEIRTYIIVKVIDQIMEQHYCIRGMWFNGIGEVPKIKWHLCEKNNYY